jgi:hypothetical protein
MKTKSSRREFLALGLSLPAAGMASLGPLSQLTPAGAGLSPGSEVGLNYRTLGRTGLKVTTVGFGCAYTSDASVIERAADLGVNYFDTARVYQHGNNERMVGEALKGKRQDIVLSSKTPSMRKEAALTDLDRSLRELGTDYLDIWCLHGRDKPEHAPDDLIEAQQIAKKQGKIRYAGVSTHVASVMIPFLVKKAAFDVVLIAYNFTMDQRTGALLEQAAPAGMGVVAMKIMAGGLATMKATDPLYLKLQQPGASLGALKWVLKNPSVHTTVPAMTDMAQLEENLRAMQEPLTAAEEKLLARRLEYLAPRYCRMCGECEGSCAQGLPVANILRFLTYAEGYGQFAHGREEFQALPAALTQVRCNDCPSCTVTCPFRVQVKERLCRAQELFA